MKVIVSLHHMWSEPSYITLPLPRSQEHEHHNLRTLALNLSLSRTTRALSKKPNSTP